MRLTTRVLAGLACALSMAGAARAQELDRLIPKDTAVYVSVENLDRTRERFESSPLKALWNDASVQKFLERPLKKWSEMMEEDKQASGITIEEVIEVVSGSLAFAVTSIDPGSFDSEEVDADLVMLAGIGENGDKVREMIGNRERIRLEDGKQRRFEEEFRDITIVFYRSTEETEGEDESDSIIDAWYLDGSTFAKSNSLDALKQLIVMRDDEATPRLADDETYLNARERTGERSDLFVYVGLPAILGVFEAAEAADAPEEGAAPSLSMSDVFVALGLHGIRAMALQSRLGREGLVNNLFVVAPGAKNGLLKIYDGDNSALLPPAWVPQDAISASALSLDLQAIWKEVRSVATKMDPNAGQMIDMYLQQFKAGMGLDLEADLIGSLGKEVSWYQRASAEADPNAPEAAVPSAVFAIEVTDKSKLEGVLNIAQAMMGGMMQIEDYLGMRIRTIATPVGVTPALALMPERLIFATNVDDLKEILSRLGKEVKGMRDLPAFTRILEHLPANRMYVNFSRESKALRQSILMNSAQMTPEAKEIFDLSLFPSAEVLEKYLDVGASAMVNEEGGLFATYFLGFKKAADDE